MELQRHIDGTVLVRWPDGKEATFTDVPKDTLITVNDYSVSFYRAL